MIDYSKPGLLIFGSGGHARCVFDAVHKQGVYRVAGFVIDDRDVLPGETVLACPVLSVKQLDARQKALTPYFAMGIGDNVLRHRKTLGMERLGFEPATIVHPFSSIGHGSQLGRGVLICAGAILDCGVTLGDGVIMNVSSGVGHDSEVAAYAHISAGAYVGARAYVGEYTFAGMGSTTISGLKVGRNVFVAAGALLTKEVPNDMLAIGAPARFRLRETLGEAVEAPH